jgi:Tfp pilus assembly protein PilO
MTGRGTTLLWGGTGAGLLLAAGLLVYPAYREVASIARRMESLRAKVESLGGRTAEVERLTRALDEANARIAGELRQVPGEPDVAAIFRRLSLPVDGMAVRDQTFSAGAETEAVPGAELPTKAIPVTVDMLASFEAIFHLLQAAESMERLVRVSTVKVSVDREAAEAAANEGFLAATIELDAVFEQEPAPAGEVEAAP